MAATSLPTSNFYANNPDLLAINDWAAKNANNDSVKGLANDLFYNFASAGLQTRSDVDYARQMTPEALRFQQGQQDISTAADLRRLAAEGDLVRGLTEQQGQFGLEQRRIEGATERYGADRQLNIAQEQASAARDVANIQGSTELGVADRQTAAQRYLADQQRYGATDVANIQAGAERDVATTQAGAQRYLADQQRGGATDVANIQGYSQRYTADVQAGAERDVATTQAGAQRYLADQQRAGSENVARTQADATRYGFDSQERQIGLTGEQERLTEQQRTTEQLRLRADARGAIRSAGKTFYG